MLRVMKKALPYALVAVVSTTIAVGATMERVDTLVANRIALMLEGSRDRTGVLVFVEKERNTGIVSLASADGSYVILDSKGLSFFDSKGRVRLMLGIADNGTPLLASTDKSLEITHNQLRP